MELIAHLFSPLLSRPAISAMAHVFDTSASEPSVAMRAGHAAAFYNLAQSQSEKFAQPASHSASPREPPGQPPSQIGSWLLESLAHDGAFTRVYRARPANSDGKPGHYALKVLQERWHDDPAALGRLRYEWIVGRAVAHRRVVSILSAHLHRPPYYIVMPWIEARSVAAQLSRQCQLETPVALWIARQAAEGLEALHNLGYSHGDVNPANILFAADGHVTLIDLSCARRCDNELPVGDQAISGVPLYLAPEIFAGQPADLRSDIYSLGITLFEMLAGRLPMNSHDLSTVAEQKLRGALPSVRVFAPHTPGDIAQFIRLLTARDPLRRPQRARDAIQALERLEIATLAERVR